MIHRPHWSYPSANDTDIHLSPFDPRDAQPVTSTPRESTSPIVTFAHKDAEGITKKLAAANVSVRLAEYWMRIARSIYNDMADVERLLEALS